MLRHFDLLCLYLVFQLSASPAELILVLWIRLAQPIHKPLTTAQLSNQVKSEKLIVNI